MKHSTKFSQVLRFRDLSVESRWLQHRDRSRTHGESFRAGPLTLALLAMFLFSRQICNTTEAEDKQPCLEELPGLSSPGFCS